MGRLWEHLERLWEAFGRLWEAWGGFGKTLGGFEQAFGRLFDRPSDRPTDYIFKLPINRTCGPIFVGTYGLIDSPPTACYDPRTAYGMQAKCPFRLIESRPLRLIRQSGRDGCWYFAPDDKTIRRYADMTIYDDTTIRPYDEIFIEFLIPRPPVGGGVGREDSPTRGGGDPRI